MEIRLVQDSDYSVIARLRRQTIRNVNSADYSEDVIKAWAAKVSAKNFKEDAIKFKRWVAIEGEKIAGFCEHNFNCKISRIYVHKDFLRKGVGSRLMKVAENSLKKQGCKVINLESTITAKNFYEKNGYKTDKKTLCRDVRNAQVYLMSKKIS